MSVYGRVYGEVYGLVYGTVPGLVDGDRVWVALSKTTVAKAREKHTAARSLSRQTTWKVR